MAVEAYKAYPGSLYGAPLENYIENTVIIKEQSEVKKFIQYFLWKLEAKCEYITDEARKTLHVLLNDERLLKKIQIVSLTSWRNHVISIFPNNVSWDLKDKTIFEALDVYRSHCNVVFCI
ncbi:hypothetical protein [Bacillus taeanensis]|uniref:Uncharacterized protein n=1 Tax=Bacillus taeanensis TaxID=273032 RepID=A0A366XZW9_9BACI|nr:hypothetical protein [Bacillus taeanensis]RBW71146.1 hypothetical protein DS031_03975 [Bacillus taeanensis]